MNVMRDELLLSQDIHHAAQLMPRSSSLCKSFSASLKSGSRKRKVLQMAEHHLMKDGDSSSTPWLGSTSQLRSLSDSVPFRERNEWTQHARSEIDW